MQFKVPQDVQQADRIVWFLSLGQLIICVIGFAFAYAVYTMLNKQGMPWVIWFPPVLIIGGITAAFAFLRIANMPFHLFLAVQIERFLMPTKRLWIKGADHVIDDGTYISPEDVKQQQRESQAKALHADKTEKMDNIEKITDVIDVLKREPEPDPLSEIDQAADHQLLEKAFFPETPVEAPPKEKTAEEAILELSAEPTPIEEPTSAPDLLPEIPPSQELEIPPSTEIQIPEPEDSAQPAQAQDIHTMDDLKRGGDVTIQF